MLSFGTDPLEGVDEKRKWDLAKEFLTYTDESHSLVSPAALQAAARMVDKREKHQCILSGRSSR